MLYHLVEWFGLESAWGPLRLFGSYAFLASAGTILAALAVLFFLPRLWERLPHDHGKAILGKDGMKSAGKPTGAGKYITLLVLPVFVLFAPLRLADAGVLVCLYLAMLFGYLDDRSAVPWGENKKLVLDLVICFAAAACIWVGYAEGTGNWNTVQVWVPFVKGLVSVPWWLYVPGAACILVFTLNATNCSDGVDGLAGTLSCVTLAGLAVLLYAVIGNMPVAQYLRIFPETVDGAAFGGTYARVAARWAVTLAIAAGGTAGYLWWNAEPSKVLMGDAGSRFLGLAVGVGTLVTANPFLVVAFAPVLLVNGGGGLVKMLLIRVLRKAGLEVRPLCQLTPEEAAKEKGIVKLLHGVRFPLHDHCKKTLNWSNAQVLMRFTLLQIFLIPVLFVLFLKIR